MPALATQPAILAPVNIIAHVLPFHLDPRITLVEFKNNGNTGAPKRLSRAALIPQGVSPPQVLLMCPNQQTYIVPADAEVSQITITIGEQKGSDVLVLVAVIDIESMDGDLRHVHACANFD